MPSLHLLALHIAVPGAAVRFAACVACSYCAVPCHNTAHTSALQPHDAAHLLHAQTACRDAKPRPAFSNVEVVRWQMPVGKHVTAFR